MWAYALWTAIFVYIQIILGAIMRHMGYQPWIGLPNILAREFVVPEYLQHAATPQALADAVQRQLDDPAGNEALARRFLDMHHSLLRNSAEASADAVLRVIGRKK